ncbi:hypothetical protein STEG23_019397 [Scotinomys teguina]
MARKAGQGDEEEVARARLQRREEASPPRREEDVGVTTTSIYLEALGDAISTLPVSEENIQGGSESGIGTSAGVKISGGVNPFVYVLSESGIGTSAGVKISGGVNPFVYVLSESGIGTSAGVKISGGVNPFVYVLSESGIGTSAGVKISGGVNTFVYVLIPHGCNCITGFNEAMEAEDFTIFIKNSIHFPLFNFEKGNLLPNLTAKDIKTCRFHPEKAPFCPILRVGDVVKFAGQDFAKLAWAGGVLGIKIGWVCDPDKAWDQCIPKYSFTRLDGVSEKSNVSTGYNFRFAKYYKTENGSEYRTLLKAFGIRFDVLVYGNAGKLNIIPTIISSMAAFTSVGVGTVLCDIILLSFLKGADHYKARKSEEVNATTLKGTASTKPVFPSDQATVEKQSTDSGADSISH